MSLASGRPSTLTDGRNNLPTVTDLSQSDDWRDQEILFLREEVKRLRAELDRMRGGLPFRNWEMRERGYN